MDKNLLSLENLDIPEFDKAHIQETKRMMYEKQERYRKKYGKDWRQHYYHDLVDPGYDVDLKFANECIYAGRVPGTTIQPGQRSFTMERFWEQAKRIYGSTEWAVLLHAEGDPAIAELLLQDAVSTGKWKELPDCLQDEYYKRINDKD